MQATEYIVHEHAQLDIFIAVTTAQAREEFLDIQLVGRGAQSNVTIVSVLDQQEHYSLTTRQNHLAPQTQSSVITKSIVRDAACSSYCGTIHINQSAPGSQAIQESYALVMGGGTAHAKAVPALEVLTDDVQCRHGSAIGYLTPEHVFYAMSRGLSQSQAELMIMQGFLEEALNRCPDTTIRATINQRVQAKLINYGEII